MLSLQISVFLLIIATAMGQEICEEKLENGTIEYSCCPGYGTFNDKDCLPMCEQGCINGICREPNVCECFEGFVFSENRNICVPECDFNFAMSTSLLNNGMTERKCKPKCSTGCPNGYCSAPNVCECFLGYRLSSKGVCEPICSLPTPSNAICSSPGDFKCKEGYDSPNPKNGCTPICKNNCPNGTCIAPDLCDCNHGYKVIEDGSCIPTCKTTCPNGKCIATDKCICNEGYNQLEDQSCVPHCKTPCKNGKCIAPDECDCDEGYTKSEKNVCTPDCPSGCQRGSYCHSPNKCKLLV